MILQLYLIHWPVPFKYTGLQALFPRNPENNDEVDINRDISIADTWKGMYIFSVIRSLK